MKNVLQIDDDRNPLISGFTIQCDRFRATRWFIVHSQFSTAHPCLRERTGARSVGRDER
jgi:hypothetical protein